MQVLLDLVVEMPADLVLLLNLLNVVAHFLLLLFEVTYRAVQLHDFDVALINGLAIALHCVFQLLSLLFEVLDLLLVLALFVQQFLDVVFLLNPSVSSVSLEFLQHPQALVHFVQRQGQSLVFIE